MTTLALFKVYQLDICHIVLTVIEFSSSTVSTQYLYIIHMTFCRNCPLKYKSVLVLNHWLSPRINLSMEKRTRLNFSPEKYGLGLYRFPPRIGTIFHYIIYIIKKKQFQYRVSTLIIVPFSTQTICFWLWQSNNQKFPKSGNTKLLKSSDPFAGGKSN